MVALGIYDKFGAGVCELKRICLTVECSSGLEIKRDLNFKSSNLSS